MTVSILVPFYQVAPFIERCARSVLEQTYPDIEYLFIDDHSTDDGPDILRKTLEDYPERKDAVRIIRNERNLGLASSRNLAVRECRTDFLLWVDADDWITPDAVERLVALQEQDDADIVSGRVMVAGKGQEFETPVFSLPTLKETLAGLFDNVIMTMVWGRLIRTSLYRDHEVACLDRINYREDFQVLPKLFYYASSVANLDAVIYYYWQGNPLSYNAQAQKDRRVWLIKNRQDMVSTRLIRDFFRDKYPDINEINEHNVVWYARYISRNAVLLGDREAFLEAMQELKRSKRKHIQPDTIRLWYAARISPSLSWLYKRIRFRLAGLTASPST